MEESCFWRPSIHTDSWGRRRADGLLLKKVEPTRLRPYPPYLLSVGVEGHGEVQQQLPLLHPLDEGLQHTWLM